MLPRNLLTRTTEYTWPVYIADMGNTKFQHELRLFIKTQSMTGLFSSHTKLTKEGEF